MKTYIGIDPGLQGGIAIITGDKINIFKMPLIAKGEIDIENIFHILSAYDEVNKVHVCIEDVHSIFGASAGSNFTFGFGCGQLDAVIKCCSLPFTKVPPKIWQKEMWSGVKPVLITTGKKDKKGMPKYKIDTKATSLIAAKRLFPKINFLPTERCTKEHDGMIDAILIAQYARIKNL